MSTLTEHLQDLGPTDVIARFVLALAERRNVESDRRNVYLSLRPSLDGAIAVYVHRELVSVALDPGAAADAQRSHPSSRMQPKTRATTYAVISSDDLAATFDSVVDLAAAAVDWRASGPKWSVGSDKTGPGRREPDICPDCNFVITPANTCGCP